MARKMSNKALEKLVESLGGVDEIRKGFERHRKDSEYFEEHSKEFLRDYKEEWVAVYNCKVVGHNKDFLELIGELSKEERENSVIHLITTRRMTWILSNNLVGVNS